MNFSSLSEVQSRGAISTKDARVRDMFVEVSVENVLRIKERFLRIPDGFLIMMPDIKAFHVWLERAKVGVMILALQTAMHTHRIWAIGP